MSEATIPRCKAQDAIEDRSPRAGRSCAKTHRSPVSSSPERHFCTWLRRRSLETRRAPMSTSSSQVSSTRCLPTRRTPRRGNFRPNNPGEFQGAASWARMRAALGDHPATSHRLTAATVTSLPVSSSSCSRKLTRMLVVGAQPTSYHSAAHTSRLPVRSTSRAVGVWTTREGPQETPKTVTASQLGEPSFRKTLVRQAFRGANKNRTCDLILIRDAL